MIIPTSFDGWRSPLAPASTTSAITHIGFELDHKLADLLVHLGAAVPPALTG